MAAEEQIKELANTMWEQEATQARDSKPSPPPGQSVRKQSGRRK